MSHSYNKPTAGSPSSIGNQFNTFFYAKKALIELVKEQYFSPLSSTTNMPKNYGKQIKKFLYLPLLDDRNINDEGIDAAGVTITSAQYYVRFPRDTVAVANASKGAAVTAFNDNLSGTVATAGADGSGGSGLANITLVGPLIVKVATEAKADAIRSYNIGATKQRGSGNMYGSTKDVGSIQGKLPVLSEAGGRVNRVGFKRIDITGSMEKFGFFDEYTQDSLNFDTDEDLLMHINREMLRGANEITEDALQIDLLNGAGTIRYAGAATSHATVAPAHIVTYSDLMRLSIDLDNNRTPKQTTIIEGSRMVDTVTIPSCRVLFIGSELIPTIRAMKDLHNNPAFIPVNKYSGAGTVLNGEIGVIDQFRIVVVPEMMKWAGAGAATDGTVYDTNGRVDVFPMMVVGDESFTTIGFQTDGKSLKFKIISKKPGEETADRNDPFGETGFMAIKWFYGILIERPERIAIVKTAAKL